MNIIYCLGLSLLLFISPLLSHAVDLVYKWKAGTVYRFQAVQTDDISTSMNMMGMNQAIKDIYKTDIIFGLKVTAVQPNGTADAIIYVESFKVTNKAGKVVASLAGIPKESLSSPVEVDKKGNFKYKKIVYMIVQDNMKLLVTGKAENNKVSATTTGPDGKQLSVNAEFDPKTGTLKAGYTVANVGKPQTKKVAVKEEAQELNILPYDFLAVFSLPEGDVVAGQSANMKMSGSDVTIKTESILNNIATMKCNFKTDMKESVNNPTSTPSMEGTDGNGNGMNMNMDMGNMNMGGMDMGGMDMGGGMTNEEKAMVPDTKTDGDITVGFDIAKGMFKTLNGTIKSSMNAAGMQMETKSTIVLKAL